MVLLLVTILVWYINKKQQNTHEPRNLMRCICSNWPEEASYSPGSAVVFYLGRLPQMLLLWPIRTLAFDSHHCMGDACCSQVWLGSGVYMKQFTCWNQSGSSVEWNKSKKGVCEWMHIWIFSSGLPSMKTTIASNIKQLFKGKDSPSLSLVNWYSRGLPGSWGLPGWQSGEMFCVYIVYAIALMNDMVWFGLFPSPFVNSLCSFFPLCCTIRTLQWDTDPSVLQLQSDSELGYMSALLLLLLLFLCYSCVEMLELLLLLLFPSLLNFQFDKFISFC